MSTQELMHFSSIIDLFQAQVSAKHHSQGSRTDLTGLRAQAGWLGIALLPTALLFFLDDNPRA